MIPIFATQYDHVRSVPVLILPEEDQKLIYFFDLYQAAELGLLKSQQKQAPRRLGTRFPLPRPGLRRAIGSGKREKTISGQIGKAER